MDDDAATVRIGDGERQAAIEALVAHREAGRLDPVEFEERQVAATRARTWAEIGPLFADLPEPRPAGMPAAVVPALRPAADLATTPDGAPVERQGVLGGLVPARYRDTVMALTPFVALLLFFTVTRTWIVFLAIPVMGILLYGAEGRPERDRHRRRDRH